MTAISGHRAIQFFACIGVGLLSIVECAAASSSGPSGCRLNEGPTFRVAAVVDGETLRLVGGASVRLIGALAPRPPLANKDLARRTVRSSVQQRSNSIFAPVKTAPKQPQENTDRQHAAVHNGRPVWPPARAATRYLEGLVLGRSVTLWGDAGLKKRRRITLDALPRDRYGHVLAQVTANGADGESGAKRIWLQGAMLRAGVSRSYSATNARTCVRQLQLEEDVARKARLGIWASEHYMVRQVANPQALRHHVHTFQVVEGKVRRVSRYGRVTYINFGRNWRDDFTLTVKGRAHRRFSKVGLSLEAMEGRRIRVRGWIELQDGPMIRLSHPEQIEVLDGQGNAVSADLLSDGDLSAFDRLRDAAPQLPIGPDKPAVRPGHEAGRQRAGDAARGTLRTPEGGNPKSPRLPAPDARGSTSDPKPDGISM